MGRPLISTPELIIIITIIVIESFVQQTKHRVTHSVTLIENVIAFQVNVRVLALSAEDGDMVYQSDDEEEDNEEGEEEEAQEDAENGGVCRYLK
jgi:hypothetical protein